MNVCHRKKNGGHLYHDTLVLKRKLCPSTSRIRISSFTWKYSGMMITIVLFMSYAYEYIVHEKL
jgi:hypothetical protein